MKKLTNTLLPLTLLLAACATPTSSGDSGFLKDYSILAPNPDVPDVQRWISADASQYERILVVPFVAYFHPNVAGKPINANELDDLLTRLRSQVIAALADDSLMATEPGPGVLRLEVAITDLHEQASAGSDLGLGNANVELRATDSQTGTLLAAATQRAKLDGLEQGADGKWALAREAAKIWAQRIAAALDAARDG
jgi:hypothetical protein